MDPVNGDDVVMAHRGRRLGFAGEPEARGCAAGQERGHHLDCHQAVQRCVERLEDDAHTALADHLPYLVVAQHAEDARAVRRGEKREIRGRRCRRAEGGFYLGKPFANPME